MTKSLYADRDTVGTTYLKAQAMGEKHVEVGDMCREVMSSLVEDLNDTIMSNPHQDRPFYITIHESKDLQMKSCLRRRMLTTVYRPWPEDDTTVFWTDPKSATTLFCWTIPHWSEMDNMLNNEMLYDKELIATIKAWKSMDLYRFGFCKDDLGNWIPNLNFKDKKLEVPQTFKPQLILV
jgi:hypothetical protein